MSIEKITHSVLNFSMTQAKTLIVATSLETIYSDEILARNFTIDVNHRVESLIIKSIITFQSNI